MFFLILQWLMAIGFECETKEVLDKMETTKVIESMLVINEEPAFLETDSIENLYQEEYIEIFKYED